MSYTSENQGFTLIEILISLAIVGLVMAGLFTSFRGQQQSHLSQSQTVEMQQTARGTLYIMAKEIRMAGYDPEGQNATGIVSAGDGSDSNNALTFTYVFGETDDDPGEVRTISYYLYDAYGDGDGNDGIGRAVNGSLQPLADNIETLRFRYLDSSGAVTTTIDDVRAVEIQIAARVDQAVTDYTLGKDTRVNRTVTTIVNCRNLGL
ncbi:MAG: prepilin-type N-terminal cleavage/methylation domain-containing protein [Desulfobacterales bacterium]|nr:prepilin-type N-terminal cleavage/methylation domain-containing protein [Desulfobacterales bacterium]